MIDIKQLKEYNHVLVSVDKSTNFYSVLKDEYKKLLTETITKIYKKAEDGTVDALNSDSKVIAQSVKLPEIVQVLAENQTFVTLKLERL